MNTPWHGWKPPEVNVSLQGLISNDGAPSGRFKHGFRDLFRFGGTLGG